MSDEAVRKEFEKWADVYELDRERLVIGGCPKWGRYENMNTQAAWQSWQAARSAAIQECAAIADYEHGKAAGWEEQTDSNAAWYVKVTCERIEAAILALKER